MKKSSYSYNKAKRVKTPDGTFDSAGEYAYWCKLKLRLKAGEISDLKRQTYFDLRLPDGDFVKTPTGRVATYQADFDFLENGVRRYLDYKGYATPENKFKIAVVNCICKVNIEIVS